MNILIILLGLFSIGTPINASNILFMAPFPGLSQWLYLKTFIKELVSRGHDVTAITTFPFGQRLENYTEILIDPPIPPFEGFDTAIYSMDMFENDFYGLWDVYMMGPPVCEYAFNHLNVQKFMQRNDLHFDLVVAELFVYESFLMFAHKYKAPVVGIYTLDSNQFNDNSMGLQTPLSHVPHWILSYGEDMTITQRFYNVVLSIYDYLLRTYYIMPIQNEMAQKYFQDLKKHGPLPSLEDLERSISVILTNSHRSFSLSRPQMPGIINIAGAHVVKPKPLPHDIQKFLDNSVDGVIYFSLGTNAKSSLLPKEKMNEFLETFAQMKQQILWKLEDENIPNLPANVMVRKWMPQSDILAHKNVVLFITHGGLFGTIEGLERGVPSLIIPLFGDQRRNAVKAVNAGYAKMIKFSDVNKETLKENLIELLDNPKYQEKVKRMSVLLKDNLIHPLNESIFWMEYVIRHKGAKHLKSTAANMNFFSYWLLDILGIILISLLAIVFFFYKCTKRLLCKLNKKITTATTETKNVKKTKKSKLN